MNLLKCLLLVTFGFLCHAVANAQNFQTNYLYDENGNRIEVQVIYLTAGGASNQPAVEDLYKEDSQNFTVKVYPNPTAGSLTINFNDTQLLEGGGNEIVVLDMQGRVIKQIKPVELSNKIDLSEQAMGVYVLRVKVSGITKMFKVIKN